MIAKPTPRIREPKPLKAKRTGLNRSLRDRVFDRDGMLCQWCKVPGGRLDPHHILPRGRGGKDELDNLVSLHRLCHDYIHTHPSESKRKGFLA